MEVGRIGGLLMVVGLLLPLCDCAGVKKSSSTWDNIDYQRQARSKVYTDNDAAYTLPSVVTCGGDDDSPVTCK